MYKPKLSNRLLKKTTSKTRGNALFNDLQQKASPPLTRSKHVRSAIPHPPTTEGGKRAHFVPTVEHRLALPRGGWRHGDSCRIKPEILIQCPHFLDDVTWVVVCRCRAEIEASPHEAMVLFRLSITQPPGCSLTLGLAFSSSIRLRIVNEGLEDLDWGESFLDAS